MLESRPRLQIAWLPTTLLMCFAMALGMLSIVHEPWRDEIETWAWAASSTDMGSLLQHTAYDPNPRLWFLVLFLASRFSDSIWMLKLVNFVMAVFCGSVIVTAKQLDTIERAALLGSYFILYEYGTIARPYALIAGCVLLLARWAAERKRAVAGSGVFAIAALSSLFGVIAALPMAIMTMFGERGRRGFLGGALVLTALIISIGHAAFMPPDFRFGAMESQPRFFPARSMIIGEAITAGLLPMPKIQLHFWNTSLLPPAIAAIAAVLLLIAAYFNLRPSRRGMFAFFSTTALLVAFSAVVGAAAARHQGLFFIAFVGSVIIARNDDHSHARVLLPLLLIVQCLAAAVAVVFDVRQPFSRIVDTAKYVSREIPATSMVVGLPDTVTAPVAFLARRDFYFPNGDRQGRTVVWDLKRRFIDSAVFKQRIDQNLRSGRRVFVVTNRPIAFTGFQTRKVAVFAPSIVADESYVIYELTPQAGAA